MKYGKNKNKLDSSKILINASSAINSDLRKKLISSIIALVCRFLSFERVGIFPFIKMIWKTIRRVDMIRRLVEITNEIFSWAFQYYNDFLLFLVSLI